MVDARVWAPAQDGLGHRGAACDELRAHYHGDECGGESDDRRGGR